MFVKCLFVNTIKLTVVVCLPYQVGQSVNAKHKNGRFYGAFVSCVNADGTYQVYFIDDCDVGEAPLEHSDIKLPIATKRNKCFDHWTKFVGKVFYDTGTKADAKKKIEAFEPGEFVVKEVAADNNFLCCRVGTTDTYPFDVGYVLAQIREYEEE